MKQNLYNKIRNFIGFITMLIAVLVFGNGTINAIAQTSPSVSFVPLIGITSVPDPLALPRGPGDVIYHYAVKNFSAEAPLTNISVVDDNCNSVKYLNGDDNHDLKLDYNETWRYTCTTKISKATQSIATATGIANDITATDNAFATVVVGSNTLPPLVSIINTTKVAYPLTLPADGGKITFTYKVNNPGVVPLSDVTVIDDKCGAMSGKLGDTNGNNLLDLNEVWIYTCTTTLTQTMTSTARVTAFANGLVAEDNTTLTVKVVPIPQSSSNLFDVTINPVAPASPDLIIPIWIILSVILTLLTIFFLLSRKNAGEIGHLILPNEKKSKSK